MQSIYSLATRITSLGALALLTALIAMPRPAAAQAAVTTSSAHAFPDGPTKAGSSSTLVRNDAGVTATFLSPNMTVGDVYTFWWVIFNQPENCSGGVCGLDDVVPFPGNSVAGVSLVYGGGHIIANSGRASFGARLAAGDTDGAMFGPGLVDPVGAEIHIVLRTHGPVIPELLDAQLNTFGGACDVNTCANEISAEHQPLNDETAADVKAMRELLERVAVRQGIRP